MSSNLKVNTILPSTGTTIGIGTVGGLINVVGNIDVNSTSGISTFNGLEISGIVTAKAGAAVTYYGDGSNLTSLPAANLTGTLPAISGANLTNLPDSDSITEGNSYAEILDTGTNGIFRFVPEGSEVFRITHDGKMGLNETNPTRDVVFKNAGGNCQVSITAGTSNSAYLNLGDTDDDNIGSIYYSNSDNRIVFRVNTTDTVRMESDGNIRILDGNLKIATAGHGIDFSSAADDSTNISETVDSSVLDDYEEGQFTPAVQFDSGGGSIVYGTRYGRYRKVGNMVHITYYMEIASGVSSSDFFARLSLPFNGYGGAVGHQDARIRQWNTGVSDWFVSLGGSAPVFFMNNGNGSGANYARGDDINGYKLSGQYTLYT